MQTFKEKLHGNRAQQAPTTTTPYSSEFIRFINESRQEQTLFANSVGNSEAEFSTDGRKSLEEYLSVTLSFSQFEKNCKENEKDIQLLADKILKSFNGGQQKLQLSLIWIFYYSPSDRQTNCLPVFQIKNMHGVGTKYMDISLTFFNTWTELIGNVQVGHSFLCVPRNGVYQSEEFVLDLEYMWSRPRSSKPFLAAKKFVPFTISCVQNWVMVKGQQLNEILSKAVTAAITFYKAHHSKINCVVNILIVIAETCINPSLNLEKICSLLTLLFKPYFGTTSHVEASDRNNSKLTAGPVNGIESIKKIENICNNAVDLSKVFMNGYKNRSIDLKSMIDCMEKLSLISEDVKSLSKDLIVPSLMENVTNVTINESARYLENVNKNGNVRNGVLSGTSLSDSHTLSPCNLNINWQKYSVCTYYGSDFTEVQKMALCFFKRDLKFDQKSNKLLDFSGKNVGYIYILPNMIFCIYLTSEIYSNESENYKFLVM